MTLFEFLMAIASVVVAIGIIELARFWGELARSIGCVKLDWLHLLWTWNLLLVGLTYWLGLWPYREAEFTYYYQVLFLVLPTLFFVITTYTITTSGSLETEFDLRQHFLENTKKIFVPFGGLIVSANIADVVIMGIGILGWPGIVGTTIGAVFVVSVGWATDIRLHYFAAITMTVACHLFGAVSFSNQFLVG